MVVLLFHMQQISVQTIKNLWLVERVETLYGVEHPTYQVIGFLLTLQSSRIHLQPTINDICRACHVSSRI